MEVKYGEEKIVSRSITFIRGPGRLQADGLGEQRLRVGTEVFWYSNLGEDQSQIRKPASQKQQR